MPGRRILIAGGSGFVGERLVSALATTGEEVVVLSRSDAVPAGARLAKWDGRSAGDWVRELDGAFAVINLAGEPIAQKWTPEARRRILDSRVQSAEAICAAIGQCEAAPKRWINASAVGYYGNRPDAQVYEDSPSGDGFLAETCLAWEDAVTRCPSPSVIRTRLRIGMVLGHGGALGVLAKLARLGLGGSVGDGRQPVSWIHLDDLVGMIAWLLDHPRPPEVMNATAPNPVTNAQFMKAIRGVVKAPFGLPAPAFGVRLVGATVGPDPALTLEGARVLPRVAMRMGYSFHCPDLVPALEDLLGR